MRLLIDADGCPVVDIAVATAKAYQIACLILCDTAHVFDKPCATTLIFPKGADSVDFALVNMLESGDVVVTQDYGLAAMCLARNACPIDQNGKLYTPDNIDAMLMSRHTAKKLRDSDQRLKGPSKRTPAQNSSFKAALEKLLAELLRYDSPTT